MYKYIKSFELGFIEGIKDAFNNNYKYRKFKKIDDKEIIYKLYDIGYIKGYKKISLKKNKSIV
jgi:hypothetical protein